MDAFIVWQAVIVRKAVVENTAVVKKAVVKHAVLFVKAVVTQAVVWQAVVEKIAVVFAHADVVNGPAVIGRIEVIGRVMLKRNNLLTTSHNDR